MSLLSNMWSEKIGAEFLSSSEIKDNIIRSLQDRVDRTRALEDEISVMRQHMQQSEDAQQQLQKQLLLVLEENESCKMEIEKQQMRNENLSGRVSRAEYQVREASDCCEDHKNSSISHQRTRILSDIKVANMQSYLSKSWQFFNRKLSQRQVVYYAATLFRVWAHWTRAKKQVEWMSAACIDRYKQLVTRQAFFGWSTYSGMRPYIEKMERQSSGLRDLQAQLNVKILERETGMRPVRESVPENSVREVDPHADLEEPQNSALDTSEYETIQDCASTLPAVEIIQDCASTLPAVEIIQDCASALPAVETFYQDEFPHDFHDAVERFSSFIVSAPSVELDSSQDTSTASSMLPGTQSDGFESIDQQSIKSENIQSSSFDIEPKKIRINTEFFSSWSSSSALGFSENSPHASPLLARTTSGDCSPACDGKRPQDKYNHASQSNRLPRPQDIDSHRTLENSEPEVNTEPALNSEPKSISARTVCSERARDMLRQRWLTPRLTLSSRVSGARATRLSNMSDGVRRSLSSGRMCDSSADNRFLSSKVACVNFSSRPIRCLPLRQRRRLDLQSCPQPPSSADCPDRSDEDEIDVDDDVSPVTQATQTVKLGKRIPRVASFPRLNLSKLTWNQPIPLRTNVDATAHHIVPSILRMSLQ